MNGQPIYIQINNKGKKASEFYELTIQEQERVELFNAIKQAFEFEQDTCIEVLGSVMSYKEIVRMLITLPRINISTVIIYSDDELEFMLFDKDIFGNTMEKKLNYVDGFDKNSNKVKYINECFSISATTSFIIDGIKTIGTFDILFYPNT